METVFLKMCFDVILSQRNSSWGICGRYWDSIFMLCNIAAEVRLHPLMFWAGLTGLCERGTDPRLLQSSWWKWITTLFQVYSMWHLKHHQWAACLQQCGGPWGKWLTQGLDNWAVSSCVPSCFCRAVLLALYLLCVSSLIFFSQSHFISTLHESKTPSPRPRHSDDGCWKQKLELQPFASSACTSNPSDSSLGLHSLYGQLYEILSWSISLKFEFSCCFYYLKLRPFVFILWNIKSFSFLRLNYLFLQASVSTYFESPLFVNIMAHVTTELYARSLSAG